MDATHKKLMMLVLSDIFILSSFGLIAPIFAVFIMENLSGGGIVTAGLATTIFLVVKCSVQLPLSKYFIDKHNHKARFLVLGTLLIITVPFIYVTAKSIYTIYIAQAVYGLGAALAYPAWFSLFTMYMDKKQRGFEYAIYTTAVGVSTAIAAVLGAKIAEIFGFKFLFFLVGIIAFLGFLFLIALYKLEMKKAKSGKFPKHPFNKIKK
ncbi:MAG: MFS transporter [Candidatus Pacearchaeota archaeon]|nr:MFS transporter [Candidatus Pacearchaeota archaeon]